MPSGACWRNTTATAGHGRSSEDRHASVQRKEGIAVNLLDFLLGDKGSTILAGALGGVVRWITLKERLREGIASVVCGAICAVYLGPIIRPAITPLIGSFVLEEASRSAFGGFILGLGGITVSGFVIDFIKGWARRTERDRDSGDKK